MPRRLGVVLLLLLFTGACLNLSTFQNGRTVGRNKLRFGLGASTTVIRDVSVITSVIDRPDEPRPLRLQPSTELFLRYGLTDTFEVNLELFNAGGGVGLKSQVLGTQTSRFAMSLGTQVSLYGIRLPREIDTEDIRLDERIGILDVTSLLYFSYAVGRKKNIEFYASPRLINRTLIEGVTFRRREGLARLGFQLFGGNLGVAIGRKTTLFLEGNIFAPIGFRGVIFGGGVGISF